MCTGPEQSTPVRLAPIVLAFLVTRLAVIALYSPEIHAGDQAQYVRVARSLLDHGLAGYLDPGFVVEKGDAYPYFHGPQSLPDGQFNPIFWDPLYPLFLSAVYAVAGVSHGAVRIAQLALSLLTLLIGMDTVRRMFPSLPRAAEVFGWWTVAYLPFAGFVARLLAETLEAFLLTTILWTAARLAAARPRVFFGFGLLLGLYTCIKSYWLQLLPAVLVLLGWLLASSGGGRMPWRGLATRLLLVMTGVVPVLVPTYVRNYHVGDGTLLVSTKASWNLWKDNNHFRIENHGWRVEGLKIRSWLGAYYPHRDLDRVPLDLEGVYYGDAPTAIRPPCDTPLRELVACERNRALAFFLEDPLRFARRALEKNANLWSPNSYIFNRAPPGPWAWNQNYRLRLPTTLRYGLQLWGILCYLLAMLLFFLGITLPSESETHRYVRAFVVFFLLCLTLVVVPWGHGVTRFRLPFTHPILMFAALGGLRARAAFAGLASPHAGSIARIGVVGALTALLAAVCVARLPVLLAP